MAENSAPDAPGISSGPDSPPRAPGKEPARMPVKKKPRVSDFGALFYTVLLPILLVASSLAIALFGGAAMRRAGFTVIDFRKDFSSAVHADFPAYDPDKLCVFFFDVGQADAALVRTPSGHTALIDAGSEESSARLVKDLKKLGVRTIDYFVLSHPHEDHIGGAPAIFDSFNVLTVVMPDVGAASACWMNTVRIIGAEGSTELVASPGLTFSLPDDCLFTALAPADTDAELNNCSVILRLDCGEFSFLFTGDAEKEEELALLKACASDPSILNCSVLKTAHHGSSTSSCPDFIFTVRPEIAVISCGRNNDYGHPHRAALRTLAECGARVFRTDLNGDVIVVCDNDKLAVHCRYSS